jgi:hypothetical protein
MKKNADGWRVVGGHDCYVEDGKVVRCKKQDRNGSEVTAYPYRRARGGGWDRKTPAPDTLRAGLRSDTYRVL